jgi:hypothetical protein
MKIAIKKCALPRSFRNLNLFTKAVDERCNRDVKSLVC